MLAGLSADERAHTHLNAPIGEYRLLNQSGCVAIDGVDDAAEMQRTKAAMEAVGLDETERAHVTRQGSHSARTPPALLVHPSHCGV